jgi:hypothetical protein
MDRKKKKIQFIGILGYVTVDMLLGMGTDSWGTAINTHPANAELVLDPQDIGGRSVGGRHQAAVCSD